MEIKIKVRFVEGRHDTRKVNLESPNGLFDFFSIKCYFKEKQRMFPFNCVVFLSIFNYRQLLRSTVHQLEEAVPGFLYFCGNGKLSVQQLQMRLRNDRWRVVGGLCC